MKYFVFLGLVLGPDAEVAIPALLQTAQNDSYWKH